MGPICLLQPSRWSAAQFKNPAAEFSASATHKPCKKKNLLQNIASEREHDRKSGLLQIPTAHGFNTTVMDTDATDDDAVDAFVADYAAVAELDSSSASSLSDASHTEAASLVHDDGDGTVSGGRLAVLTGHLDALMANVAYLPCNCEFTHLPPVAPLTGRLGSSGLGRLVARPFGGYFRLVYLSLLLICLPTSRLARSDDRSYRLCAASSLPLWLLSPRPTGRLVQRVR